MKKIYAGTFLIAFAMLALEVTITRLLSVVSSYHLAFFAIALALLGMTAGSATIYLSPKRFEGNLYKHIAGMCVNFGWAVPLTLLVLCIVRVEISFQNFTMEIISLIFATLSIFLPFYFAGIALSLILTRAQLPIGRLYAADLSGAALGSVFVLVGLEVLDAPGLILLCCAVGAVAGAVFATQSAEPMLRRRAAMMAVLIALLGLVNSQTSFGIQPMFVKGRTNPVQNVEFDRWNSYSYVTVDWLTESKPQYWGPSPLAPETPVQQRHMVIDGDAGTDVRRFSSPEDIEHLRYDVTNIAYYLRPSGGAFIIGVGGGRDAQSALLFGHEHVTAIDVNPIFIDLLQNQFRDFAGLANREDVTLLTGEGRSYLSNHSEQYSVIQMSLIDTWAATGAGAFTLSENALYTLEAWRTFFNRLADDGVFTVSRWYNPANLGETGRTVSLATATLLSEGQDPLRQIALVTSGNVATLVMSRNPFTDADILALRQTSDDLQYTIAILPGILPDHPILREIVSATSLDGLSTAIADEAFNYAPPTDENPYFFNLLKLNNIDLNQMASLGVVRGNLLATVTLIVLVIILFVVALFMIIIPLSAGSRKQEQKTPLAKLLPGAAYFSLIGAGFMLVEIALIQRLSVFLSHPIYALGIILFTIILSTGIGSYVSEYLPLTRRPWVFVYPLVTALVVLTVRYVLVYMLETMIEAPLPQKIVASVLVLSPVGTLLGLFFPTGMRLVRLTNQAETPWYWALNGVFSVLCSSLAVFISIYVSISMNFYIAALCYTAVTLALIPIYRSSVAARSMTTPQTPDMMELGEPQPSSTI